MCFKSAYLFIILMKSLYTYFIVLLKIVFDDQWAVFKMDVIKGAGYVNHL